MVINAEDSIHGFLEFIIGSIADSECREAQVALVEATLTWLNHGRDMPDSICRQIAEVSMGLGAAERSRILLDNSGWEKVERGCPF